MKYLNCILVPVDFSEVSMNALESARQLAVKSGASLVILHVNEYSFDEEVTNEINTRHRSMLLRIIEKKEFKNLPVEYEIDDGPLLHVLLEKIEQYKVDLIVTGSTGSSGLEELLTGSNAERIVRSVSCPVLTIKEALDIDAITDMVFATDLKKEQDHLIEPLQLFQKITGAKLHILLIVTPGKWMNDREVQSNMEEFTERNHLENFTMNWINEADEEIGIRYFASEVGAQVIALGTHSRTGLAHFFKGSIAEDVVNHASRAVWTYSLVK